jgi:hypothetical protein
MLQVEVIVKASTQLNLNVRKMNLTENVWGSMSFRLSFISISEKCIHFAYILIEQYTHLKVN